MKSVHLLHLSPQFLPLNPNSSSSSSPSISLLRLCKFNSPKPSRLITLCASIPDKPSSESSPLESLREGFLQFQNDPTQWNVEVGSPKVVGPSAAKLSLGDQVFFLMAFIACTVIVTSISDLYCFCSLVLVKFVNVWIFMISLWILVLWENVWLIVQTSVAFTSLVIAAVPAICVSFRLGLDSHFNLNEHWKRIM